MKRERGKVNKKYTIIFPKNFFLKISYSNIVKLTHTYYLNNRI